MGTKLIKNNEFVQFLEQILRFACFAGRRREKKEIIIMHTYLASVLRSASINTRIIAITTTAQKQCMELHSHRLIEFVINTHFQDKNSCIIHGHS